MKVKELIELLKAHKEDRKVYYFHRIEHEFTELESDIDCVFQIRDESGKETDKPMLILETDHTISEE